MNTERKKSTSSTPPQHTFLFADQSSPHQRTTSYPNGISFSMEESQHKDLAYLEKRSAHNALERQRREGLNTKYQELAHVLPALDDVKRPSKNMIVTKSLEFVSNASKREKDYKDELAALKKENEQLQRQAKLVRRRKRESQRSGESSQWSRKQQVRVLKRVREVEEEQEENKKSRVDRRLSNSTCESYPSPTGIYVPSQVSSSRETVSSIPAVRTPVVQTGNQAPYDLNLLNLFNTDQAYDDYNYIWDY
ncbi:hypothetical protein G6F56_011332 [Rhizopus delemar]|nr:hypothetical protein G6F56_011332 [Rhizopus delemar]